MSEEQEGKTPAPAAELRISRSLAQRPCARLRATFLWRATHSPSHVHPRFRHDLTHARTHARTGPVELVRRGGGAGLPGVPLVPTRGWRGGGGGGGGGGTVKNVFDVKSHVFAIPPIHFCYPPYTSLPCSSSRVFWCRTLRCLP